MNDKLENNKLDDNNLEKVSGGEVVSCPPYPLYPEGTLVYWRGHGYELFLIVRAKHNPADWFYSICPCDGGDTIHNVKEEDLSKNHILY